jgi:MTH538 TIR-like domain (DUF1863)
MGLPRTFVGFSSTDIIYYRMMQAWKVNEHIDFNFTDCQLEQQLFSENEQYIKSKCRERLFLAGKYVMLIGEDTKSKHKYVRWEAEVAIDKGCTIIGVNINGKRDLDVDRCPPIIRDIGAVFVSFKAKIIAHALEKYEMGDTGENYYYKDETYRSLGIPITLIS